MRVFSALSETFIYDRIVELERQGDECRVVAGVWENRDARPFAGVVRAPLSPRWHPRRVLRRALSSRNAVELGSHVWPDYQRGLEAALQSFRPSLLHAHFGAEAVIAAPVARRMGLPLVVSHYGYDVSKLPLHAAWRERYAALWDGAAATTVLSREMYDAVVSLGCPPSKVQIVPLGKDLREYPLSERRTPVRTFVSVGRLVEKKGHLDAIRAVQRAAVNGIEVRLRIVGDGPLRDELDSYVRDHGLESCVSLLGALPHDAARREMAEADAFILCSKTARDGDREGTPTVLLEAQALGLPCVTTRHAGIPEVIPAENHWLLAPEGDLDGLNLAIRQLAGCSEETLTRVREAGRAHVEAHFALGDTVRRLRSVYQAAIGISA